MKTHTNVSCQAWGEVRMSDTGYKVGYTLKSPHQGSLHADFARQAVFAWEVGTWFTFNKSAENDSTQNIIKRVRATYDPCEEFHGTTTWNVLKSIFWESVCRNFEPKTSKQFALRAAFGSKGQKQLTCALYQLPEKEHMRILQFAPQVFSSKEHEKKWHQHFRGAQGVTQLAKTFHRLNVPCILPTSYVDSHYGIDLFCAHPLEKGNVLSLQVKSVFRTSGVLSEDCSLDVLQDLEKRHTKFNQVYKMKCVPSYMHVLLSRKAPYATQSHDMEDRTQRFLQNVSNSLIPA